MRRIAVISDVHGNILALERVVEDLAQRDVDLVVNLGDHLSGPLWPKETSDFLRKQDWIHLLGNHDRQLLAQDPKKLGPSDAYARRWLDAQDLNWLGRLPSEAWVDDGIVAFHGAPENDLMYLLETIENGRARLSTQEEIVGRLGATGSPVVLCGHSHIPRIVEMPGGRLIVNPGSVGLPAYDDTEPEPHVMENGSPHARYAILERSGDSWITEVIVMPYNHQKAAEQARKNRRKDWGIGLETGYMSG